MRYCKVCREVIAVAEHRFVVSALADIAVVIYADTREEALEQGFLELDNGVIDTFSIERGSVEVDLIEEETEA